MMRSKLLGRALLLAVGVLFAAGSEGQQAQQAKPAPKAAKPAKPAKKPAAPTAQMVLEPRAIDILKAASARLAAAKSMAFTAVVSYESPSRLGPPLVYTTKSEVTLQRPDKLQVITPRRRPGLGVLLRRQGDDGVRAGREPGRRRRCAADDRRGAAGGLRFRGDLLPVHRRDRRRSVQGHRRRTEDRLLHRPVEHRRRHDDGHGGVRHRRRVRADLDRRRGQAAAPRLRGVPQRSRAAAPRAGTVQLATGRRRSRGRLRFDQGGQCGAHRVRAPRRDGRARNEAAAEGQVPPKRSRPRPNEETQDEEDRHSPGGSADSAACDGSGGRVVARQLSWR